MDNFNAFNLPSFLIETLEKLSITVPTPIQASAIPLAMEGHDILASAQTGTGKTIAYLLPMIPQLLENPNKRALILAPTRELAIQVKDMLMRLVGTGKGQMNLALIIGGDPMFKQLNALKKSPQIVIGTPGRIIDHLDRGSLKLNETEFLVLDETDRMLDMGFSEPLKMIIRHLPTKRQTMMFSATLPPYIIKLSQEYLNNPKQITIGSKTQPIAKIKQETVYAKPAEKYDYLLEALDQREGSIIIFVKTRIGAERLASKLKKEDHEAAAIHGDLRQRQREKVLLNFRKQNSRILVATDVAARGLDIPHVMHVINFDIPQCPEDYIHRIGRTGRAGAEGHALSFIAPEDQYYWKMITRLMDSKDGDTGGQPKQGKPGFGKKLQKKSFGGRGGSNSQRKFGDRPRRDGANNFEPRKKFPGRAQREESDHFERNESRGKFQKRENSDFLESERPKRARRSSDNFGTERTEFRARPKREGSDNFEAGRTEFRSRPKREASDNFETGRTNFRARPKREGSDNFETGRTEFRARPRREGSNSFGNDRKKNFHDKPKRVGTKAKTESDFDIVPREEGFGFKQFPQKKTGGSFRPKFWGDKSFKKKKDAANGKQGFKKPFGAKKPAFAKGRKKPQAQNF